MLKNQLRWIRQGMISTSLTPNPIQHRHLCTVAGQKLAVFTIFLEIFISFCTFGRSKVGRFYEFGPYLKRSTFGPLLYQKDRIIFFSIILQTNDWWFIWVQAHLFKDNENWRFWTPWHPNGTLSLFNDTMPLLTYCFRYTVYQSMFYTILINVNKLK